MGWELGWIFGAEDHVSLSNTDAEMEKKIIRRDVCVKFFIITAALR